MSDKMTIHSITQAQGETAASTPTSSTLILAAHGSVRHASAIDHIDALCAQVRRSGPFADVRAAYLMGGPDAAALDDLTLGGGVTIVPYMMTDGALAASMTGKIAETLRSRVPHTAVHVGSAVGTHPLIADIAADRVQKAVNDRGLSAEQAHVVLIAHGSEKHPASRLAAEAHVMRLCARKRFASVSLALLEEAPSPDDVLMTLRGRGGFVILVGLFAAPGGHAIDDINDIDNAATAIDDIDVVNAGFVGLDPRMADIVLARADTARQIY